MNRKSFAQKLALMGICPIMINELSASVQMLPQDNQDEKIKWNHNL